MDIKIVGAVIALLFYAGAASGETPTPTITDKSKPCRPGSPQTDPRAPIVIICDLDCANTPEPEKGTPKWALWHNVCDHMKSK
jgi:hypothetical protein